MSMTRMLASRSAVMIVANGSPKMFSQAAPRSLAIPALRLTQPSAMIVCEVATTEMHIESPAQQGGANE